MRPSTILLVEDNPDDAELARVAFARWGVEHELVVVDDGLHALEYCFRRGEHAGRPAGNPQLVLLDLKLPDIDGFEVLHRLRAERQTRHVPVVVFTSSAEPADLVRSYELGANSYVRKPVSFDDFVVLVEQLGRYWLSVNQPALEEAL